MMVCREASSPASAARAATALPAPTSPGGCLDLSGHPQAGARQVGVLAIATKALPLARRADASGRRGQQLAQAFLEDEHLGCQEARRRTPIGSTTILETDVAASDECQSRPNSAVRSQSDRSRTRSQSKPSSMNPGGRWALSSAGVG